MPKIKQPDGKKARKKKGDSDLANTTEGQDRNSNSKKKQ